MCIHINFFLNRFLLLIIVAFLINLNLNCPTSLILVCFCHTGDLLNMLTEKFFFLKKKLLLVVLIFEILVKRGIIRPMEKKKLICLAGDFDQFQNFLSFLVRNFPSSSFSLRLRFSLWFLRRNQVCCVLLVLLKLLMFSLVYVKLFLKIIVLRFILLLLYWNTLYILFSAQRQGCLINIISIFFIVIGLFDSFTITDIVYIAILFLFFSIIQLSLHSL